MSDELQQDDVSGDEERHVTGFQGTTPPPEAIYEAALHRELERRIEEVSTYTDEAFGRIGQAEWFAFCMVSLVLPGLIVWYFA